jgi:hypothetical protein
MPGEETGGRKAAMKHPSSRAERRYVRLGWIARRRFIAEHVWRNFNPLPSEHNRHYYVGKVPPVWYRPWKPFQWGRWSKFNMNCGCRLCHVGKYFKEKRKRRRALDDEVTLNLESWGVDIGIRLASPRPERRSWPAA